MVDQIGLNIMYFGIVFFMIKFLQKFKYKKGNTKEIKRNELLKARVIFNPKIIITILLLSFRINKSIKRQRKTYKRRKGNN